NVLGLRIMWSDSNNNILLNKKIAFLNTGRL
ncbi:MAG: hypothetical protein ACI82E_001280, partial [Nonlabens sp.]